MKSPEKKLFNLLDVKDEGKVSKGYLLDQLKLMGIQPKDSRLEAMREKLAPYSNSDKFDYRSFIEITKKSFPLIEKAINRNMIIPNFEDFCREINEIYAITLKNHDGEVASYIPQLARVDPEQYAVSICTIDGQTYSLGDCKTYFCIQSVCKAINYCIIQQEHGEEKVHQHIGKEPSGHGFNTITLNSQNLPHNPMINSGAIMAASLLKPDLDSADRFDYVMKLWESLCGGIISPRFNNSVYLSEKNTADRNFALGYFMREKKIFPAGTHLLDVLQFYFQCCSIEMTAEALAVVSATLADAGMCPLTHSQIFHPNTVKNCLSLMSSCGMYDFSGEFAFSVGLPAKSGVAGALIVVIPNVMGICIWSPRLDSLGNSVRGIAFCNELIRRFNFHNYDSLINTADKKDPRLKERNN